MSKKVKKTKTTLADRNREALLKTKSQVKPEVEKSTTEPTPSKEEEPKEKPALTKEEQKKIDEENYRKSYEKAVSIAKEPDKYTITEVREFSNREVAFKFISKDGKTEGSISFPGRFITEGDGIKITIPWRTEEPPVAVEKKEPTKAKAEKKAETPKKEEKKKESKVDKPKKEEKPIEPEVVFDPALDIKNSSTKKEEKSVSITEGINALADRKRLDENHQVDLLKLINDTYINNHDPNVPAKLKEAMTEVFNLGICQVSLIAAAQWEAEGRSILGGIEIKKEMCPLIKQNFLDLYGVTGHILPGATDSQLKFNFDNIPEPVKAAAKADAKAPEIFDIPKPDPKLPEDKKIEILRSIMKRTNQSEGTTQLEYRQGQNLMDAIDWTREAFEIKSKEPAAALAVLCEKFQKEGSLLLKGFIGMSYRCCQVNNTPFVPHAIVSQKLNKFLSDQQIANVVRVLCAAGAEQDAIDKKDDFVSHIKQINTSMDKGADSNTIESITKLQRIELDPKTIIDGRKVYNLFKSMTNNGSSQIISDKLKELANYYNKPIERLANYKDESAYSK